MKKHLLGDITFTTHNKREELWYSNIKSQVNYLCNVINNPDELVKEYGKNGRNVIIETRVKNLHGEFSACFWCDIIKNSVHLYSVDDFNRHFNS